MMVHTKNSENLNLKNNIVNVYKNQENQENDKKSGIFT